MTGTRPHRWLLALMLAVNSLFAIASTAHTQPKAAQLPRHAPAEAVDSFLLAIERGELLVFGQRIERSMISPLRVEYVYDLNNLSPKVHVYSILKKALPVPGNPRAEVRGIRSLMGDEGRIIDNEAHVWPTE